jgi:hypothetical protein
LKRLNQNPPKRIPSKKRPLQIQRNSYKKYSTDRVGKRINFESGDPEAIMQFYSGAAIQSKSTVRAPL